MDERVLLAQKWLNQTYGNDPNFTLLEENGQTGTLVFQALTKGWQIELRKDGYTDLPVTGNFASKTQQYSPILKKGDNSNYVRLLQHAFFCKGYGVYDVAGKFETDTEKAVRRIQSDAGLPESKIVSVTTAKVLTAIFSADYYTKVSRGDPKVRKIQQDLNAKYSDYIGLGPCDGVFSRGTATALVYGVQAEEGLPVGVANGYFGPTTKNCLPEIPYSNVQKSYSGSPYSTNNISNFIILVQYALYCYGHGEYKAMSSHSSKYDPGEFNGDFNAKTKQALHTFQKDVALPIRDMVGRNEWMALLVSTGNPDRHGSACDCATKIDTSAKAQALVKDEYKIVGRYLTGRIYQNGVPVSKSLDPQEIQTIFNAGLSIFAIYQDAKDWYLANPEEEDLHNYFDYEQGKIDAPIAVAAAEQLGIPHGEIIYFAVDYDFYAFEVTEKIIPYFQGIKDYSLSNHMPYQIGIYGARNTCEMVRKEGLTVSSFVGDLATGYSGNLGFPLPEDWAFDQVKEYPLYYSDGSFAIDKDVTSGRYNGFNTVHTTPYQYGAVKNPVTAEIFPIDIANNFKEEPFDPDFEEIKDDSKSMPTRMSSTSFNIIQFLMGLNFDGPFDTEPNKPPSGVGSLVNFLCGGLISSLESLETVKIDVHYYRNPKTGEKKAMVLCGDSDSFNLFYNWDYSLPFSLKGKNGPSDFVYMSSVNNFAKKEYEKYKGVPVNDNYHYDIEFTLDERRKGSMSLTQLFLGEDKKMYEHILFYPTENIEIVISSDPMGFNVVERFSLIEHLNPVTELPEEKCKLFNIQTIN